MMFAGFAGVWTPAAMARELRQKPVSVTIAAERIVLFRGAQGQPAALIDRCPHRGVALSLGAVTPEGALACPFHGWEYGPDGLCSHIPLNDLPADKRRRAKAMALPVREVGGMIWVYTGTDVAAPPPLHVPGALTEPGWVLWHYAETWDCHWTRAMENMLDMPHVPYLHRRTIGRGMRRRITRDSRMTMHVEPTEYGMAIRNDLDGVRTSGFLEWHRPNGMALYILPPESKRGFRQHMWCVPVDEIHTRMMLVSARTFGGDNPISRLFDQFNRIILGEDRNVVQSTLPKVCPHPSEEMSVATDAPTLAFRRYYFNTLHESRWPLAEPPLGPPAEHRHGTP
ncbi:MAG: aromatic ring-hydroxylating dioxygenase subunit alpha [Candidatus Sericytochromatia bacterium]|nr:aromatic ring-hydroxylating dioxygenase subunit alpha [Candidatus Sericytochromatia bacterium]